MDFVSKLFEHSFEMSKKIQPSSEWDTSPFKWIRSLSSRTIGKDGEEDDSWISKYKIQFDESFKNTLDKIRKM